jgi:hypothetical protein
VSKATGSTYAWDYHQRTDNEGRKNDSGKLRYDLVPAAPLAELAAIYTMGAAKYSDWNWARGMAWSRVYAALMRHLQAWWQGERDDLADGQQHLGSVAWCALTLMEYERLGIGEDDRRL